MVADATDHYFIADRDIDHSWRHVAGAFYLYPVLMERNKTYQTILVLILALGVWYWFSKNQYLLIAAGVLAVIGLLIPALADMIHWAWMKLAEGLGYVMSRVVLTIIFFVILVPLSFISRLFRKNTMQLKKGGDSYYKQRNFTYTKESMENLW